MERPLLRPASSYGELWRQVDFATMDIPERFNLGVACADRQDPDARALTVVEVDRSSHDYTFGRAVVPSLGGHEAVAMAAVVGVPDERRGQVPKAFIVLRPGREPTDELRDELRTHVRTRLAPHEMPRDIEFVDDLPRTTTGKIMRRALRDV